LGIVGFHEEQNLGVWRPMLLLVVGVAAWLMSVE
jgi:hypothetical protein